MKKKNGSRKIKSIDLHKFLPRTAQKGTSPGTVEYIGKPRQKDVEIAVIEYDEAGAEERVVVSPDQLSLGGESGKLQWICVSGVHDAVFLKQLGNVAGIDPLDLEAIANTTQRPATIERERYIFVVLKLLQLDSQSGEVGIEQVSLILGPSYVISFHETNPLVFQALRNRIFAEKGRIRRLSSDYLLFALCDIVTDQYFSLLENVGEAIENAEDALIVSPVDANQEIIYKLKRRLVYVRKTVWPTREAIAALQNSDHELIHDATRIYFRDIYDHTIQVIETLDSLREITSGMMDLYMSAVSNRMNEIMKVLTIFSALFIPVTFLAGVYGMNFKVIPELDWKYGYVAFWGVVLILASCMFVYFKRRKWF